MLLVKLFCLLLLLLSSLPSNVASQALDRTHVNYTNPLQNGSTCTAATLQAAITAVGSAKQTLFITKTDRAKANCTWVISSNITFAVNTTVYIPSGVNISVSTGITLTFNGPVLIDDVDSLQGVGSYVFNYPQLANQPGYVTSSCLPTVPSASLTIPAFTCSVSIPVGNKHFDIVQSSNAIALSGSDGQYWLLFDFTKTRTIAGWNRITGTHYLYQTAATIPATPTGSIIFAQVTVSGAVITAIGPYTPPKSMVGATLNSIVVSQHATSGDGTAARPWLGWETAFGKMASRYILSPGTYQQTVPIVLQQAGALARDVQVIGAGRRLTQINYTGSAGIAWSFGVTGSSTFWSGLSGVSISNTSGNTVTAVKLIDVRYFSIEDSYLQSSTSLHIAGREFINVRQTTLEGSIPLLFDVNPNFAGGGEVCDYCNFEHVQILGDATGPLINFAAVELHPRQVNFVHSFWAGGTAGFFWKQAASGAANVTFDDVRWEQSSTSGGYAFDVDTSLIQHFEIKRFTGGEGAGSENGIRLRDVQFLHVDHLNFNGSGANVALDIDTTVSPALITNVIIANATASVTGLWPTMIAPPASVDTLAGGLSSALFNLYVNRTGSYLPGNIQVIRSSNNLNDEEFISFGFSGTTGGTPNGCSVKVTETGSGNKALLVLCSTANVAAVEVVRWGFDTVIGSMVQYLQGFLKFSGVDLPWNLGTFNNSAAAATGTLTNSPVAGNPTKWIRICETNGAVCFAIPAWQLP